MSIHFDTSVYFRIDTSPPSMNADYTFLGWVKFDSVAVNYGVLNLADGATSSWDGFRVDASGVLHEFEENATTYNINLAGSTTLTAGTWYQLAIVRSGSSLITYIGGVQEISATGNIAGRPANTTLTLGAIQGGAQLLSGSVYHWAAWTKALTAGQIQTQQAVWPPSDLVSIYSYWPLATAFDNTDGSGNGNHWSINGTPTTDSNPSPATPGIPGGQVIARVQSMGRIATRPQGIVM